LFYHHTFWGELLKRRQEKSRPKQFFRSTHPAKKHKKTEKNHACTHRKTILSILFRQTAQNHAFGFVKNHVN